jgi:hypothetical protein
MAAPLIRTRVDAGDRCAVGSGKAALLAPIARRHRLAKPAATRGRR